jgi:hypothetical protein
MERSGGALQHVREVVEAGVDLASSSGLCDTPARSFILALELLYFATLDWLSLGIRNSL